MHKKHTEQKRNITIFFWIVIINKNIPTSSEVFEKFAITPENYKCIA